MGNFIVIDSADIYTPTAYVKNTEDTSFPATNVGLYTRPYRPWKTSGANVSGTSYVGVNLGSAKAVRALVVDNINLTSVYFGYSTNGTDWFTCPNGAEWTGSSPTTISTDPTTGKGKVIITGGPLTKQYWRILSNSDPTDGVGQPMQVGSFMVVSAYTTWTVNPGYPYSATGVWPAIPNSDGIAQGAFPVAVGNRYAEITLSSSLMPTTAEADLQELMGFGEHRPLVFYRNYSSTAEVYVCHVSGRVRYAQAGPNHLSLSDVVLRECS